MKIDGACAGKNVTLLVGHGVNENEMTDSQRLFLKMGATIKVISTETGLVNSWAAAGNWGLSYPVDKNINETLASDLDVLIVLGGSRSLAKLKSNPHTKRILNHFIDAEKPLVLSGDAAELLAHIGRTADEGYVLEVAADEKWQELIATHITRSKDANAAFCAAAA